MQNNISKEFLLEEYKALESRSQNYGIEGVSRLNAYLILASVLCGSALFFLGNNINLSSIIAQPMLAVVMILLTSVGFDTWFYILKRQVVSDKIERGLARIRHYFVERDETISKYLVNSINDDPTSYIESQNRSNDVMRIVQKIQAFTLSLAFLSTANVIVPQMGGWLIIIGIVVFSADFFLLEYIGKQRFSKAQEHISKESIFPLSKETKKKSKKATKK
jgi:hypothetical protein